MKAKLITWIMATGLVLSMSTAVWADGRYHHRDNRPTRRIVIEKNYPVPHHPQYRKHPAYHKRWVHHRGRDVHYYAPGNYCDSVYEYRYYKGHPRHSRDRIAGAWIAPGWTFSISTGERW